MKCRGYTPDSRLRAHFLASRVPMQGPPKGRFQARRVWSYRDRYFRGKLCPKRKLGMYHFVISVIQKMCYLHLAKFVCVASEILIFAFFSLFFSGWSSVSSSQTCLLSFLHVLPTLLRLLLLFLFFSFFSLFSL